MVSWLGYVFEELDQYWKNLRQFAFYNRTIFEIFFIGVYAVEQFLLIWYTFNSNSLEDWGYIISMFAVIVLTTFALHKLLMESRIRVLEDEVKELQLKKFSLESSAKEINDKHKELVDNYLSQVLKTNNHFSNKRGSKDE